MTDKDVTIRERLQVRFETLQEIYENLPSYGADPSSPNDPKRESWEGAKDYYYAVKEVLAHHLDTTAWLLNRSDADLARFLIKRRLKEGGK